MLAGQGIRAVVVLWVMVVLSFIVIPLRLYTRMYIVKAVGPDDYAYNLAWVNDRVFKVPSFDLQLQCLLEPSSFCSFIPCFSLSLAYMDSDNLWAPCLWMTP